MKKAGRGRHRDHGATQPPAARQPATFYMHVLGHGDPAKLATALHDGLAVSKTPLRAPARPAHRSPRSTSTPR